MYVRWKERSQPFMLSIRMQRTGRKGHAMFRLVVQESRLTPTSGKVVAQLGSFDPHGKTAKIDIAKATVFLNNGAQPSGRAALLLQKEGVDLPSWVKLTAAKNRTVRHPEKLRRNQPSTEIEAVEEPVVEDVIETPEATSEETIAVKAETAEQPAETTKSEDDKSPADIDAAANAPETETGTTES
jgi:small subunit ribosomal protein S16